MANNNTIKVAVVLSDDGTFALTTRSANKLKKELDAINASATQASKALSSAKMRTQGVGGIQENIDYRNARGVSGSAGGGSRDFAKQAQGLGGLVHLYATFAANIFAVGSAFSALNQAFSSQRLEESARVMGSTIGINLKGIATDLQKATDYAISFQDALKFGSIGTAAGLSGKQIKDLTVIAKGASNALGRDMGDSIDRIIRGTAKMEQEILDELGIFVRAKDAYKTYATQLGLTSEDMLTSSQRVQAYANAVEKAGEKWKKFAEIQDPFSKFVAKFKEAGTDLLNIINKVITPVVSVLAQSETLLKGLLLAGTAYLVNMAIPALQQFANLSKSLPKYREEIEKLQKAFAIRQGEKVAGLQIEKSIEVAKLKAALENSLGNLPIAEKTKQNLIEKIIGSPKDYEAYLKQSLRGASLAASNSLKSVLEQGDTEKISKAQEKLQTIKTLQQDLNSELSKEILNRTKVEDILKRIQETDQKILATEESINSKQTSKTSDAAGRRLSRAKATSDILEGGANLGIMAMLGKEGAELWGSATKELKLFDKTIVGLSTAMRGLGLAASLVLEPLMVIMGAMAAWSLVIRPVLNYFSLLNTKSEALIETLNSGKDSIQTIKDSYKMYSETLAMSTYSTEAFIQSNTILKNSYNQVTASISEQIIALKQWQANRTFLSDIFDNFGTSNFDKVKANIVEQIQSAAKMAASEVDREKLRVVEKAVQTSTTTATLEIAAKAAAPIMGAIAKTAETSSESIKGFQKVASDASASLGEIADKQLIKDKGLLAAYKTISAIAERLKADKGGLINQEAMADFIKMLQGIDKDSPFAKLNKDFEGLVEKSQKIAEIEKKIADSKLIATSIEKTPSESIGTKLNNFVTATSAALDSFGKSIGEVVGYIFGVIFYSVKSWVMYVYESITTYLKTAAISFISSLENTLKISWWQELGKLILETIKNAFLYAKDNAASLLLKGAIAVVPGAKLATDVITGSIGKGAKAGFEASKPGAATLEQETILKKAKANLAKDEAERKELLASINKSASTALKGLMSSLFSAGNVGTDKSAAQQILDAINNEITAQQKLIELTDYKIAKQQKLNGYADEELFASKLNQENAKIDLEYSKQVLEAEQKYLAAKSKGSLIEKNRAIEAAEQARTFSKEKIEDMVKESRISNAMKEYDLKVVSIQKLQLDYLNSQLNISNSLGEISKQELIDRTAGLAITKLEIEKQVILERLRKSGIVNPALQPGAPGVGEAAKQLTDIEEKQKEIRDKRNADSTILEKERVKGSLEVKISSIQSIMDIEAESGKVSLSRLHERMDAEEELFKKKYAEAEAEKDFNKMRTLEAEKANRLYKEQLELLEARKKNFTDLSTAEQVGTVSDEAYKRAAEFSKNLRDGVTGTFDAIYSGMDAAIDELTTKMMKSEKISIKDLVLTFRNTAAEEFRKMSADLMKKSFRDIASKGIEFITGKPSDLRTAEEKTVDYLKEIAENTKTTAIASAKTEDPTDPLNPQNQVQTLSERWKEYTTNMWDSSKGFFDNVQSLLSRTLNFFGSSLSGILQSILQSMSGGGGGGGFLGSLLSIGASFMPGGSGGGVMPSAGAGAYSINENPFLNSNFGVFGSANGNLMTEYGPLRLNAFARGGITNSPMVSLIGEGTKPEAYVPLPDGRTIPVTMQGKNGGGEVSVNINITDNSTTSDTQASGSGAKDYAAMAKIISSKVREELLHQKRPGGILY